MVAIVEKPLQHSILSNISWATYENLLDEVGENPVRITYDNGDLEIMTLSLRHEHAGRWIGRLIFFLALELNMAICTGGSTTLKQVLQKKGMEPDECFWIQHEKHMRAKTQWDVLTDPPPDLGVEIDITSSSLDRQGIYAALKVPEIWRYDGETLKVLVLAANGKYRARMKSLAFPTLPIEGFASFITTLGSADEVTLIREFAEWVRREVVPQKAAGSPRKNGKKEA